MANLDLSATLELIDRISAPLQSIVAQSERLNQAFDKTTASVEQFNETLSKVNSSRLNGLNQPLNQTNSLFSKAREHARGLASDLKLVFSAIVGVQKKADSLSKSFADYRKGLREQAIGSIAKMGGAAVAGYQMLKPAIAFDKQMSATQAVLELDAKSSELAMLRNQAITEGARSAFSASQAAQAQFELGAAGLNSQQVFESLAGTLDLAAAGQLEVARAAEISGGVLNAFGMQAKEMGRLGDVMVSTANKTSVGIEDIGEAMKMAAPVAKMYGASLEQTHAAIGLLGNVGIKGSDAGTGIKAIMARLATLPKPAKDALDTIKVNPVNKDGTMKDFGALLNEIRTKTEKLSTDQRMDIFKGIAGQEHFSKLEPLVAATGVLDKNTGQVVNKFTELTKQLENSADAAQKVANIQMDNLAGDIDQLKGAWESFSIALGGKGGVLNATLRSFVQGLTDTINKITAWAQANPELVKTIGSLLLKFIKLNLILFTIKYSVALVLGSFFGMLAHFIKFGAMMMLVNAILAKFGISFWGKFRLMGQAVMMFARLFGRAFMFLARQSIPFVITAIGQLATVLLTTPIGWAIMAIAVAALLIYKYWAPIKAFFTGFWDGFKAGLAPLMTTLSSLWSMLGQIFAPLKPVIDAIVFAIGWLASAFMSLFAPAQMTQAQLAGATSAGQSFGMILGTIVGLIGQVVAGLVGALALGLQTIGQAIGTFAAMVVVHGGQAVAYVASLPGRFMAFLAGLPAQMSAMGGQIMDGLKNGIMSRINGVVSSIQSAASRIKSAFAGMMGIHSPSRVFMGYGDNIMAGLNNGLLANNAPIQSMIRTSDNLRSAMDTSQIKFDTRKPITASMANGGYANTQAAAPITIIVNAAPTQSPADIAQLVAQELAKAKLGQTTNNTALYDLPQAWT